MGSDLIYSLLKSIIITTQYLNDTIKYARRWYGKAKDSMKRAGVAKY